MRRTSTRRATAPAPASTDGDAALDAVFSAVARYFGLLAEPTRLKIMHAICGSERTVSAIVRASASTQTNVSRHLALLHRAGVVTRRKEGANVYYKVADPMFSDLCRVVCMQIASRIDGDHAVRDDLVEFALQR
jgi:DNA-binding transcriptional ArsR family regulator